MSLYIPQILQFCFEEVSVVFEFFSLPLSVSQAQVENGKKERRRWKNKGKVHCIETRGKKCEFQRTE